MTRRLRIQGGAEPVRVSVVGVDAAGALFDQVIFDANQAPLRLWTTNYYAFGSEGAPDNIGTSDVTQAIVRKTSATLPSTASGKKPLFAVMWRCQKQAGSKDGTIQHVTAGYHGLRLLPDNQQGGGGGIMGTDGFYAVNWCRQEAGYSSHPNYVNYAIFRNYI